MNWPIPKDVRDDVKRILNAGGVFPKLKMDTPITILYGSAGSGKTRWAVGIAAGGAGWEYCNARELIDEMRNGCKTDGGVVTREAHLQIAPRLVIDDLADEGDDRFSKRWTSYSPKEIFRRTLMARCRSNYRTIITTNITPERLAERYDHDDPEEGRERGDDRGRIFSRFCDHTRIYFFQGDRRKNEVFKFKERTHLDEGNDKDGKPRKRIELGDRIPALFPVYEEVVKEPDLPDATEADITKAIDDVNDKGALEVSYYNWLLGGKFKHLIPKEWHEREKARVREAKLAERERKRRIEKAAGQEADAVVGVVCGGAGGDVPAGLRRGPGEGAKPSPRESGGDGAGDQVDPGAMPDWD